MSIKKAGKMPAYLSLRPFSSTILKTLISLLSPLPFLFFSVTCSHYKCFLLDFPPLLFLLLFFFFLLESPKFGAATRMQRVLSSDSWRLSSSSYLAAGGLCC